MRPLLKKTTSGNVGFTIIEVIIAVALMLSAVALAVSFTSGTLSRNELDVVALRSADALNEARSSALNGLNDGIFGVHFEVGSFVYFIGDTYSAGAADNVVYDLSDFVAVTDISISGGGSEIIFASVSGAADQNGFVEFADSTGETRTISVNAYGTVDLQ